MKRKTAIIFGAGDAIGFNLAKKFMNKGFNIALVRRQAEKLSKSVTTLQELNKGKGIVKGYGGDARVYDQVENIVDDVEKELGEINLYIHNIGANVSFDFMSTTERVYTKVWELAAKSAFITAQVVAKKMLERTDQKQTMLFTGATASVRGNANYSAFSGGMMAKRSLTQSLARELHPKNIHVCHIVIDGAVNTPFVKNIVNNDDLFDHMVKHEQIVNPEHVAEVFYSVEQQNKSTWSNEITIRPFSEKFS